MRAIVAIDNVYPSSLDYEPTIRPGLGTETTSTMEIQEKCDSTISQLPAATAET